jgi:hypothetical protein
MMELENLRGMGTILGKNALESADVSKEIKWVQDWVNKNLLLSELDRSILINSAIKHIQEEITEHGTR